MIEHAQNRLLDRVRRFTGVTGFVLVLAGVAFGLATFAILTGMTPITPTSENTLLLMLLNGAVLLVLALLIFGQILFLLIERRNGTPGASLQLRLVSLFSVIAVVPAIVVAIFATVTLNRGLDAWFSQRTRAIVDSAVYVAETYVHDHGEAVRNDVAQISADLSQQRALYDKDPAAFMRRVANHALLHGLPAIFIFDPTKQKDGKQEFIARVVARENFAFFPPNKTYLEQADKGERFYNNTLPMLCQVCQIPMVFTEPDDPAKLCYRESDYEGEKYHTCSDGCKQIFDDEPEKYVQAWLPVHQIYQGNCFPEGTDPTVEGFDPLAAVMKYYHIEHGRDNLDFEGSEDQKNFAEWRGQATKNA